MNLDAKHQNPLLDSINEKVIRCSLCPRLGNYITRVGKVKTKRFLGQDYWAKPLPSFGDVKGKLLIMRLAPAAHVGNRTGRLFTGDSSGDWVARALLETGFANISNSESKNDGLLLKDVFISTAVRCAPPNNTPTSLEIFSCSQYLLSELIISDPTIKVVLTFGKIAFDTLCSIRSLPRLHSGHNTRYDIGNDKTLHNTRYDIGNDKTLLASYHPSRQNTNTGKLTWQMWISVFRTAKLMIYK